MNDNNVMLLLLATTHVIMQHYSQVITEHYSLGVASYRKEILELF